LTQSVHFDLSEYDLQTHRVRADVQSAPRWYQFGLAGWYEFDMLNYQSYFQDGVALPWVSFYEGQAAATQLYYRLRGRDYFRGPFDPFLDALNNAIGGRQVFLLGAADRDVSFGYQFDSENPFSSDGDDFEYLGHQFDVLFHVGILGWVDASAGYQFRYETYEEENSRNASGFARRDRQSQWLIELDKPLTPYLSVAAWYIGTINGSNTDEFRYDRHVVSLGVRVNL
jgi:hypothetical protein